MTLIERLGSTTPKRILALDGGGIRGALTLGYLEKIENILKVQHGNDPSFRLCDYFDLIGGTSTGSIIAAGLAIGLKVDEIKQKYFEMGGKIFGDKYEWYEILQLAKAKYNAAPLEKALKEVFSEITIGSDRIKTGLCIVLKRADTNSIWPIINHPEGKFFDSKIGKNKDILLWKAIRASTAAPTYFLPQIIDVGGDLSKAAFVDGGVSMANNPAFQLLLIATLKGFPFHWRMGEENILLVSVGTGVSKPYKLPRKIEKNHMLKWANQIPDMLMQDASWHNQIVLQWLSNSPTAWEIDMEIGDMEDDLLSIEKKGKGLISYLRYNVWLEKEALTKMMNRTYTSKQIENLIEMSNADNRYILHEIGCKAASIDIHLDHFPESFKAVNNF